MAYRFKIAKLQTLLFLKPLAIKINASLQLALVITRARPTKAELKVEQANHDAHPSVCTLKRWS